MNDEEKTREQLINELAQMRDEMASLGAVETRRELQRSEEKFRALIENATDIVAILENDATIRYASPSAYRILGYSPESVLGEILFKFIHPEDSLRVEDVFKHGIEIPGITLQVECRLMHNDGSWRVFEAIGANLLDDPAVGGVVINARDITERKKVEAVLRESERKYRDLAELLPQTVFEVNEEGIATYVNRHGLVTFGYTQKDLKKGIYVLNLFAPEDRQRIDRRMKGRWHGKTFKNNEYVAITKDGGTMPIMVYTSLVMGEDGPIGLRGIVLDITERKRAEEALRASEEKYRLVTENINDLIAMVDMKGNYLFANEAHRTIGGYNPGDLLGKNSLEYLHPEDYERVLETFTAASDQRESDIEVRYRCADGSYRWVQSHSRVLTNENGIPEKGLMVGVDITERKLAEKALRQSEEKYRNLVEEIKEAMFTLGTDSTVTYTSGAISAMSGYMPSEVEGKTFADFVFVEDMEYLSEVFLKVMGGESQTFEARIKKKTGDELITRVSAYPIIEDGQVLGARGLITDITERRQTEEALRESEQKYRDLIENMNEVFYSSGLDGKLSYVSPALELLMGHSPAEIVQQPFENFIKKEDFPRMKESIASVLSGNPVTNDYQVSTKDGEARWIRTSSIPVFKGNRVTGVQGVMMDITEGKQAEEALRESEAWLKKAQQLAQVGSWEWDLVDGSMRISEEMYRIYGVEDSQFVSISEVIRESIYPEDKELVKTEMDKITVGLSGDPMVYRIVRPDGTLRWIAATETEVKHTDSDGKPKVVVGTVQDITERKQMENALKYRIEFEKLVTAISASFISLAPEGIDREINRALQLVGEFVGVDRSYVSLFSEDGTTISNTHEWCAKGIKSQTGKLQEMPASEPKWLMGKVNQRENIYIPCVADLPPEASVEKEAFESHGIQSLVVVPMAYGGSLLGFLGFDSVKAEMPWSEDSVALLKMVGEILANALVSKRVEKALQQRSRELYLLNTMAQSLAKAGTVGEVLQTALNSTLEATQMQLGAIYLIDENAKKLVMAAHNGSDEELIGLFGEVPAETSLVGNATLTGKVITISDFDGDERIAPRHKKALQGINIQTMINLPLKSQNRVIGVLGACSPEQKDFSEDDIRLLETIGGDVGGAIEKAQLLERTSELSITDEVTGLYNRRHFYDVLERDISRMQRYGNVLSLVMIDLDGFKEYNDRFGHTNGDAVLKEFAQTLQAALRKSDTAFRFGGDEFVITLPSTKAAKARQVMDRVRLKWLRVTGAEFSASQVPLLFSIGIAQFSEDAETTDGLVFLADAALYQSKRQGGAPCVLASELDAYTPEVPGVAMGEQVYALAAMVDAKDPYTYGHSTRVAAIADRIGQYIGVSERDLLNLQSASLLHDIGKVGVPDSILSKAKKLTDEEWEVVQRHSAEGAKIVGHIGELKALVPMILHHHEWYDGSGYPAGLVRKKIPLGARIISIADAYETMRTRRPYRTKVSHDAAIKELRKAAGTQFDPQLVEALCQAMSDTDDDDDVMSDNP